MAEKGMSLDDFLAELRGEVDAFEKWWREQHAKTPEHYPLEFNKDNEGMWTEQFVYFITAMGGNADV